MGRSGTGLGTIGKVRDGSEDDRGGPERVGDCWVGPGRVGKPSRSFGTGQGTIGEVRNGLKTLW